jgi:hypothetical protein
MMLLRNDADGSKLDAALGDALPRIQAVRERVAKEIEAELDDGQREVFRRQRQRGPGSPPP